MRTTPLPLVGLFAMACTGDGSSKDSTSVAPMMPPMDYYTSPMPPPMTTPPMTQPPTGVTGDTGTQIAPMPYTSETGDTGASGSNPVATPGAVPGLSPLPPGRATSP